MAPKEDKTTIYRGAKNVISIMKITHFSDSGRSGFESGHINPARH